MVTMCWLKGSSTVPAWMTFDRDVRVWMELLKAFNVDDTSQMELFLLSQHSDQGFQEANAIISKLLKKRADGSHLDNSSGFVHACVKNARAHLSSSSASAWWYSKDK